MTELAQWKIVDSKTGQDCRILQQWVMDNGALAASIILSDGTFLNVLRSELEYRRKGE